MGSDALVSAFAYMTVCGATLMRFAGRDEACQEDQYGYYGDHFSHCSGDFAGCNQTSNLIEFWQLAN